MKKMTLVLFIIITGMIFSSCFVNKEHIKEGEDGSIFYKDIEYLPYNNTEIIAGSFKPFLCDFFEYRSEAYEIDERYILAKKDKNTSFIYCDLGILGNQVYKRHDVIIPETIQETDKIDFVMVRIPQKGEYIIRNSDQIQYLLSYFDSYEAKIYRTQTDVDCIVFYAFSGYYGGVFSLAENITIVSNDSKYVIDFEDEYIDLPFEINDIMTNGLQPFVSDDFFYD
ncbi:MAG: hypothetical protein GX851_08830 [Clostridiales bacterium]|nr:hypothetical protein [Clostridiales bacterium]